MDVPPNQQKINDLLIGLIESRKSENTLKYARAILEKLVTESGERVEIRSVDLKNSIVPGIIPDSASFFRLIKEMDRRGIVISRIDDLYKGRGKKPVYYSAPDVPFSAISMFWPKDDLFDALVQCKTYNWSLKHHIRILENTLKEKYNHIPEKWEYANL